jgi:signal transduction histidine kinase
VVSTGSITRPGGGGSQVQTTLFRALAVLRLLLLVYAAVLNATRWREFEHPVVGWLVIGLLAVWSGFATWAYDGPGRRRTPLLVSDVAVALVAIGLTPYVQTEVMLDRHASTIPSFWVMTPVLAWAVARGLLPGLVAAVVVSLVDLSTRPAWTGTTWGNIFLLILAAGVVGYSTQRLREATEARAHAERVAATMQERARLARVVHDGVLQVLALIQRRGRELGGESAQLGRMAGEQESTLRALIRQQDAVDPTDELTDLAGELSRLERSAAVTVAAPAEPVLLPGPAVAELVAVVRACLDNVVHHVGPEAPAWVLLQDFPDHVELSIRDEGPGIPAGRLERAETEGRLGVSESIRGRVADLGGSVELVTGSYGTEWEVTVPRIRRLSP